MHTRLYRAAASNVAAPLKHHITPQGDARDSQPRVFPAHKGYMANTMNPGRLLGNRPVEDSPSSSERLSQPAAAHESTTREDTDEEEREAKKRLNIEFSQTSYKELVRLRKETDASSNVEVIRDALRIYDFLLRHAKEGWSVRLVKNKQAKEVVFGPLTGASVTR